MCRTKYVENIMNLSGLPYGTLQSGKRRNRALFLNTHKLTTNGASDVDKFDAQHIASVKNQSNS